MSDVIKVGLSTACVYPENTEAAFKYAADLGYDGIELMVWAESVSQDMNAVKALSRKYSMPVQALHAPCLLISQRVWGADPVEKLQRSVESAEMLGAGTVVIHPPFRWQRKYADGFADQVASLEAGADVIVAVENMFPMRADGFFGRKEKSAERLRKRGGPGAALSAFSPSYDPTDSGHDHYTLDLSHTATAGSDALAMLERMGSSLAHLHLADGRGASVDEHLIPGHGSEPCVEVCKILTDNGFSGQAVVEINTQTARTLAERASMLEQALTFARVNLN